MQKHAEEIIDGKAEGLLDEGETVTWQANHLFAKRRLRVRMTKVDAPHFFEDEMIDGDFKQMRHEHRFTETPDGTLMQDRFHFETPFGFLGTLVNWLFLTQYMTRLLTDRNKTIKQIAESDLWKQYLTHD